MIRKGRFLRGEDHALATLTEAQVIEMRRRAREGASNGELAGAFHTSLPNVSAILTGRSWAHVPGALTERTDRPQKERTRSSKMSARDVRLARRMARVGIDRGKIAGRFGIAMSTVRSLVRGDTWGHIPGTIPEWNRGPLKGESTANARLTEDDIRAIFAAVRAGATQRSQAIRFDVTEPTISMILNRKIWKHVVVDDEATTIPTEDQRCDSPTISTGSSCEATPTRSSRR